MTLKLKVILGSTRPGRVSPVIGAWVAQAAAAQGGFEVETVDLVEYTLPLLDEAGHPVMQKYEHEHTKRWAATVGEADAFIFVTPEYDSLPPAALVNAVQVLMKEWAYKAAGVVCYGGVSGGLRAAQVLRGLVANVGVMAIPQTVPVPFFPKFINEDRVFMPNEEMEKGLAMQLAELQKWAGALQPLRD